jgi:uncharacterized protein
MRFVFLFVGVILVINACSLNKLFLFPTELSEDTEHNYFIDAYSKDTLCLVFGKHSSPILTNLKHDTLNVNFESSNIYLKRSPNDSLNAWLFTPKRNYNGITLCFLHGNGGNISAYFSLAKPFLDSGFQIFLFDYSGFGYSSGKSSRKNVLLDADFSLKYLKERMHKDDKLIVYGQSLGGHLAVTIASQNEKIIDGLVIEGAFSSHKNIAADRVPILGRLFVAEKYSALTAISQYHKPILIIHSTEDAIIPYTMSLQLYEKANAPKQLYTIQKEHILGPLYYSDSIKNRINSLIIQ